MTDAYIRAHPDRLLATLEAAPPSRVTPKPEKKKRDHRSPEIAHQNMATLRGLVGSG